MFTKYKTRTYQISVLMDLRDDRLCRENRIKRKKEKTKRSINLIKLGKRPSFLFCKRISLFEWKRSTNNENTLKGLPFEIK